MDKLNIKDAEGAKHLIAQAVTAEGQQFLGRKAPDGKTLLGAALCTGNLIVAREMLTRGVDPNTGRLRGDDAKELPDQMPFECALDLASVEMLLDAGLLETARNKSGFGPLHVLVENNRLNETELLLKRGFSPNLKQADNRIPLHTAAYYGNLAMIELLLKYGSDVSARDHAGSTPESWARSQNKGDAVQLLRR